MIVSGSHTPGVDPVDFGLPDFAALRYERPAGALDGLVSDYFVFDSEGPQVQNVTNWMLPTGPVIRITLTQHPILVETETGGWHRRPTAALYGPATRARRVTTNGGVTIGATLKPAGVARLANIEMAEHLDDVIELDRIFGSAVTDALVESLRTSDQGPAVKPILDEFFLRSMPIPHRRERDIRRLDRALLSEDVQSLADLQAFLNLPTYTVRRLAKRYFGFLPVTLIARTRFMRSLMAVMETGAVRGYHMIDPGYFDTSHFLRDCKRFLGMTARQFLAMDTGYLDITIRARRAIIGAENPILDKVS